jgi:RNAse (barnase) inhibitor barstar
MPPFKKIPERWQRIDWQLLLNGGISLYWRARYLSEDVNWLAAHGYDIYDFNCELWHSNDEMFSEISRVLRFSEWWGPNWGNNLDALADCLRDMPILEDGGVALVFQRFNTYVVGPGSELKAGGRSTAEILLDVMARTSRYHLLTGYRFITLVQVDDPRIRFGDLGAVTAIWNRREWLEKDRTGPR